ncbi:hypothetical protein ASE16_18585 [Leifsonia sp. Root227]|uniref:SRPBCC family protein n=1 Tax=Leifsonia sp. Root227 TaxID=1736496 RepID=UPI0006FCCDD8|nr:SRPBCC family protein [Leifsonia sp. Root227]KRC47317.1 hypothetical protein ASE16_18585 [Leifsonia sp. Root227]
MGEHTARVTRTLGADRERVWRAFVSQEELASWFWPPRFQTVATVDATAGSAWSIRSAPTAMGASGVVVEADEPSRIVLTWRWDGEDDETRVTVGFAEAATESAPGAERVSVPGTVLTVVHDGFGTAEAAADHVEGWEDCLARLGVHFDSQRNV